MSNRNSRTMRKLHASLDFDMAIDDDDIRLNNLNNVDNRIPHEPSSPPLPFHSSLVRDDADPDDHVSKYLASVSFTQLDDTEVFSSGDERPSIERALHGRRRPPISIEEDDDDDDDELFGGINFTRDTAPVSPLPRLPSLHKHHGEERTHAIERRVSHGDTACSMCTRLASENRRLRRLLDEADFAVAAADVERRSRSVSDPQSAADTTSPRSSSSWRSSLTVGRRQQNNNNHQSKTPKTTSSEKSRLRAQVRALSVTTAYLWQKLNTTERELADLKASGLCAPPSPVWDADLKDTFTATRMDREDLFNRAYNRS